MGVVHGRELLTRAARALAAALACVVLACGGGGGDAPDPGLPDSTAPDVAPAAGDLVPDTTAMLVGQLPDGGPMPAARNTGGIPPYPGAAVRTSREQTAAMRSFEAYTPDEWTRVVAWFDSRLGPPAWTRVQTEDMVIYQREADAAAITVSLWEPQHLPSEAPDYMREAQTAIGAAWRPSASP